METPEINVTEINIKNDDHTVMSSIVNREIQNSFDSIAQGKRVLINFITLYCTAAFGYFYYGAFIANKIIESGKSITTPDPNHLIFGVTGVLIAYIIFFFGWVLLDHVTRTIFGNIKQYKHISYMRNLSAMFFPKNVFAQNCVNPISAKYLPMQKATSLPYLFSLVNFLFIVSTLYHLRLFLPLEIALSFVLLPLGIFGIFYTNFIAKHFSEIKLAFRISPDESEEVLRTAFKISNERQKNSLRFKLPYKVLIALSWIYCLSFIYNFMQFFYKHDGINNIILFCQAIGFFLLAALSLYVTILKIEFKIKFFFSSRKDE